MATALIGAALSVVRTALSPLTDSVLEKWAASNELGSNVRALHLELLAVQALLEHTAGKEIVDNSALKKLLAILQDLGYDADDVLDELEYFRIQDEMEGTFHAADEHDKGCAYNLVLNLHHTAKAVGKQICLPSCFSATAPGTKGRARSNSTISSAPHTNQANREASGLKANLGKCFPCSSLPSVDDEDNENSPQTNDHTNDEPPKLSFDRVDASTRMQHIVEQLRLVRGIVSSTITTLGPNCITVPNIAQSRPVTVSNSIETKLYGRDTLMKKIIHQITESKHSGEVLTVIPIVGLGGIGKTTLAQHIYHSEEVQKHFEVKVWTCVSLYFNVNKVLQEIEKQIPKVEDESGTAGELIGKRLKNKRFLVVLDDIWDCNNEDEWEQLLAPFKMSQVLHGSIIMVTTRFPAQAQIMIQKIDHTVCLKGLDNKEFKELFLDIIFCDDQSRKNDTSLLEIGDKIVSKLKGSPLAAKTVGRILRNQLDVAHWKKVLESKEWEQKDGINDIMPALQLSYYYLPSYLQLCFSYCGLFPQDYRFKREELINLWIGLEVLHSSHGENKRIEDIGLSHLTELVSYGFLEKRENRYGSDFYTIHDLLHDLARKVSSHECLSIDSSQSQVSSLQIPPSIRHLSINIDDTSVEDRLARKTCVEDLSTLDKKMKVEKLRSLMLFGNYHGCFVKAFSNLFKEAKALRVILLSNISYDVEHLLHNFYKLVHLRYLRIVSHRLYKSRFPNKISRFYQMMVLDASQCDMFDLPRGMSNLAKLRHFLVKNDTTHSSIVEVGKLKSLQELRRFVVKQGQGFELSQIGQLEEICGSLCIDNLENVKTTEEADEAKLMQKNHLQELIFCWKIDQLTNESTLEEHVLERLKPSSNLRKLTIKGHRGTTCPSWLGTNLSVSSLESLYLKGVAWKKFPPIGELWDLSSEKNISGSIPDRKFGHLRRLKLCKLTMVEWVVPDPCQLLPLLEVLIVKDCPQLKKLSFEHFSCCQQGKEVNANLFPTRLVELEIRNCPQLWSFPPVPWGETPCSIEIEGTGSCFGELFCGTKDSEYSLTIDENKYISGSIWDALDLIIEENALTIEENKDTTDSKFWDVLAFHNLTRLKELKFHSYKFPPLRDLQMLSSLRTLVMSYLSNAFPFVEADSHVKYQFPVESLQIDRWNASGKDLTQLLNYLPKLSDLLLCKCERVTGLSVNAKGQRAIGTPRTSSSANKVEQQQGAREEDDVIVASEEAERGLLLLPPQLQKLAISDCTELSLLRFNPHDDSNKDGPNGGGGGLQGLTSLRWLKISDCPKLLSSYSSSSFSSSFPFPNSLEDLYIYGAMGMDTLVQQQIEVEHLSIVPLQLPGTPWNTLLSYLFNCRLKWNTFLSYLFNCRLKWSSSRTQSGHISNPHDDGNKDGRTGEGGGLQALTSLRRLVIWECPELLSSSSSSSLSSSFPFPTSLEDLRIDKAVGTEVLLPLSNLTSLTRLSLSECGDLRCEGLFSLLAQGHLTKLYVRQTPNLFVNSEPPWVHGQELPSYSSKLQELVTDDVAGFSAAPQNHNLLFSSLTKLGIYCDNKVERFTKEQEALLFVDSLEDITFHYSNNLQSLPERLHILPNLKWLYISSCKAIGILPNDALPSSLQELKIICCPEIQSLPKDCLPDSLQRLVIQECPAIRWLLKVDEDDLPSSLQELFVCDRRIKGLWSQCRRFINIIPIVTV